MNLLKNKILNNILKQAKLEIKLKNYNFAIKLLLSLSKKCNNKFIYFNLGNCYFNLKEYKKAIRNYNIVIKLDANYKESYNNLGSCYLKLKQYNKAIKNFKKIISLYANYKNPYNNLGICYLKLKQYNKAIKLFNKVICFDGNCKIAYYNLGICYNSLKQYNKAIKNFKKTINLDSNYKEAYNNLGISYYNLKQYNKATKLFNKVISLDSNYKEAYYNIGFTLLFKKNIKEGLEKYENRLYIESKITDYTIYPELQLWDGKTKLDRLLICMEQGIGDMILFFRYVIKLYNKFPLMKIDIYSNKKTLIMFSIFKLDYNKNIKFIRKVNTDSYTHKLWIMSIPYILQLTEFTPLNKKYIINSYINCNENKITEWKYKLQKLKRKRIALAWKGSNTMITIEKHIPLELFREIAKLPINLISLQKGDGKEELKNIDFKIYSYNIDKVPFEDSIAILKNIDLLITVDTSMVHLAGTLGIKTWLILGAVSDWRWFDNEGKCDLYNSVRIFRSKIINNWTTVLHEVKNELINKFNYNMIDENKNKNEIKKTKLITLIINLERRKDLWENISYIQYLDYLKVIRINAIDFNQELEKNPFLFNELLQKYRLSLMGSGFRKNKKSLMGEIGVYLSHYYCWEYIIKNNLDKVLILEDGIIFQKENFDEKILNIDNLDILFVNREMNIINNKLNGYGLQGYIISNNGARKLLNYCKCLNIPIDLQIRKLCHENKLKYNTLQSINNTYLTSNNNDKISSINNYNENLEIVHPNDKQDFRKIVDRIINNLIDNDFLQHYIDKDNTLKIPISIGELYDKYSILEIKSKNINNKEKIQNILNELSYLKPYITKYNQLKTNTNINNIYKELKEINSILWNIEDKIREKENKKEFDEEFIQLARKVYLTNDKRSELKKQINLLFNSSIIEVKSYKKY